MAAQIQPGDALPAATFMISTEDGPAARSTAEIFGGRKIALFAVPGAFTPTCHNSHMPGFVNALDAFKAKGVDAVACLSVNDIFALDAWARATGAHGKIEMLADGDAEFTRAAGLEIDLTGRGLGVRSQRYAALVEDGVVTHLLIEDAPGTAVKSSAEALLALL